MQTTKNRISSVHLENYGMLQSLDLPRTTQINLVIGGNGTGKTFFLKALYSAVRAAELARTEEYMQERAYKLSQKINRTFLVHSLGELVTWGSSKELAFRMKLDQQTISYSFSQKTGFIIHDATIPYIERKDNSVYIAGKEAFTSCFAALQQDGKSACFNGTEYDLACKLKHAGYYGEDNHVYSGSGKILKEFCSGRMEFDKLNGLWYYRDQKNNKHPIGVMSEGIKKLCTLDFLFSNGCLDNRSIIFIDDLESSLDPDAVCGFLDLIYDIARKTQIQFFLSSRSYIALKKLALIAKKRSGLVTCISLSKDKEPVICDLHDGIPDNPIVDAYIRLYEQGTEEEL